MGFVKGLKVGFIVAGVCIAISIILDIVISCRFFTKAEFCGLFTLVSFIPILVLIPLISGLLGWINSRLKGKPDYSKK